MTTLATRPVDAEQLDLLDEVADASSVLGTLHAKDFRAACEAVADADGWVNPNDVSRHLHDRFGEINPRWYSSMWSGACGTKTGFMTTHRDRRVPIDPERSKGNGAKDVPLRRLRGAA